MSETTTRKMNETRRTLEERVLEAIRQVELGRDEALAELDLARETLRETAAEFGDRIRELAAEAGEDLVELQHRLGELNYLLAEQGGFTSDEDFAELQTRIEEAATRVLDDLERIRRQDQPWREAGNRMKRAWDLFSIRLGLVSAHLDGAMDSASEEFDEERHRLAEDLRRLHEQVGEPSALRKGLEEVVDGYRRFKSVLKAFVLHPDEAKPRPGKKPEEGDQIVEGEPGDHEPNKESD